jgi:hypothetical protein
MRTASLLLLALTVGCGGRPLPTTQDGAVPSDRSPDRSPLRFDGVIPPPARDQCVRGPGYCQTDNDCASDEVCGGCFGDPCCPMCDVCAMKCQKLPAGACSSDAECQGGYCEHDGLCVITGGKAGTCKKKPATCPDLMACIPACGCDGKTYCSPCEAHQAGVSVALEKACLAPTCAGLDVLYEAEVQKARTCCPMCASLQCMDLVPTSLACGCDTHVNTVTQAMTDLKTEYYARSCQFVLPPCGIKCAQPAPPNCQMNGLCQ